MAKGSAWKFELAGIFLNVESERLLSLWQRAEPNAPDHQPG
jgi:hypothetical protein